MYLRLAFAVAAHLDLETMVVDEVLAVGDAEFQRKCLGKMGSLEREGRTVVFVSHNLDAIERLCTTVAWLEEGRLVALGPAQEVINAYLTAELDDVPERTFAPDGRAAQLRSARITGPSGTSAGRLKRDDPITVELRFVLLETIPTIDVAVVVSSVRGARILDELWSESAPESRGQPGEYLARIVIPPILNVGEYEATFWLGSAYETFVVHDRALRFRLEGGTKERPERLVQLELKWDVRRGDDSGPDEAPVS